MDFSLIKENALPAVAQLWSECFEKEGSAFHSWYFQHYALQQNKIIGGYDQGQLATMVHLNPYTLFLRGKEINTKYLVGVATSPLFRGRHVMGELLTTTFNLLRAAKQRIIFLQPINAGIYQPYGFAYTHFRQKYVMPLKALTIFPVDYELGMEKLPLEDAAKRLASVYTQAMTNYHGYVVRSKENWDNMLTVAQQDELELALVTEEGRDLGYVLYQRQKEKIIVQELLALSASAKRRLLAYLRGFSGTYATLEWLGEIDDLSYLHFKEQSFSPQLAPFMMGRVINAEGLLASLMLPKQYLGKEFIIYVKDDFMPVNTVYAKAIVSNGGLDFKPTVEVPDLTMDITTLTQLYMGTYNAGLLSRQGRILAAKPELIELLEVLFPVKNNYINEYF